MEKPMNLEEFLQDLYDSEINVVIFWLWDGGIDVRLGDELNGYHADGQVSTVAEAAAWLRDEACKLTRIAGSRGNIAASSDRLPIDLRQSR
jgi:hypothetical protein